MTWQLAEINIATGLAPLTDPRLADFVANLDRINALAEGSDGFVWRLKGEENNALTLRVFENPDTIVNMSVWESMDKLSGYVYRSDHREIMRRRKEWFEPMEVSFALWWVPAGHEPTPEEGRARLELLSALGPTPDAFTFKTPFPAPGTAPVVPILESCE
ncbi:MAG: DUF3291 domain-containing protein [Asticcacaulis sp.]|nr:DUF3291 domain-containing protein [Asticcacaulis sp.]